MKTISRLPAVLSTRQAPAVLTRRGFMLGSAVAAASLVGGPVWAQSRTQGIRNLKGLVRVNGESVGNRATINAGDTVSTGADGRVSFVVGGDAFFLRENSELKIEPSTIGSGVITSLRMITGALGAVFARRQGLGVSIHTPTVTAGIRGTGCYTEARDEGVYFCTCFGAIELTSEMGGQKELIVASHHDARMIMREPKDGQTIAMSSFGKHTDQEMDGLERLVGRRAPWVGSGVAYPPSP